MSNWLSDIKDALEHLGGISSLEDVYTEIKKNRKEKLPKTWKDIIRRRIQDHSSDSNGYKGNEDLFYSVEGIGYGVWGLRSKLQHTPHAIDLKDAELPNKVKQEIYRILRDTNLVRKLKNLHNNKCQICGDTIQLTDGSYYSEGHHIKPLGEPHNGPDVPGNIIILCPNHHVMCDYGVINFDRDTIHSVKGHFIEKKFIEYHNFNIYKSPLN